MIDTTMTDHQRTKFDCAVQVPGWRLHVAHMIVTEGRELGNVMDVATRGAFRHLQRCRLHEGLDRSPAIVAVRESLKRLGLDPEVNPPCSELLLAKILEAGEVPRGSLAWEFLAVLTAKSQAPWTVVSRDDLSPPLLFRLGKPGESLASSRGAFDCEGLPVLADQTGIKASPWIAGSPENLERCPQPVFVCCLPRELFRVVEPKSHLGRVVWLNWAYRFVFERTCPARDDAS
jgi:DNA/RNA-binding domain of Phe-tRNA-synthetase-like protein